MKKFLFACLFLLTTIAPAQADPLSNRLLQLFQDPDPQISLGAMLISTPVLDDAQLVDYVEQSLNPGDTPEAKTVKYYFLARCRPLDDWPAQFIAAFPDNPTDFVRVLKFDASLTKSVSGIMIQELINMGGCYSQESTRAEARAKVESLKGTQRNSGWAAEIFQNEFAECPN